MAASNIHKLGALIAAIVALAIGLLQSPLSRQYPIFHWLVHLDHSLIGMLPAFTPTNSWRYTNEQLQTADLRGQVALITGANSGIGFEISKALSRQGATVVLGCRSPQRCFKAADDIRSDELYSGASVTPLLMDVSNLTKVQQAAKIFLRNNDKLDMLFLNAGIFTDEDNLLSVDGIETTFATNVVGHHLLYRMLEPLLLNSTMARVVSTSSLAGLVWVPKDIQIPTTVKELNDWKPPLVFNWSPDFIQPFYKYGRSKLAQVAWSKALTRRLGENSSVYVNAAHPGAVATPLTKNKNHPPNIPDFVQNWRATLVNNVCWSSEEGALTELYLGVAMDELKEKQVRGRYFHPQSIEVTNSHAESVELQENVWQLSEGLVEKFL
ncbi:retinol dehydrogenase-related protein [Skeletonema marinoi]|uniref:Retinol dehydrogenase-related protein n=1 Tax=Skeletonema marinoi TaxID=267567 RepID=A0AAD8Y656_9STRA|nr:retinol dehydrogenase-related protein [Skeletonema marinoi]